MTVSGTGKVLGIVLGSVVGTMALMFAVVWLIAAIQPKSAPATAPFAPTSQREVAAALCSALDANPPANQYLTSTRLIPPDSGSGLAGNAQSYRQAARLIDGFCPRHFQQAELLRRMARLNDPTGG